MIVCHCAGVSDSTIVRVIEEGASSVADVVRLTGAGRCCSPCRDEIANLLTQPGQVRAAESIAPQTAAL